MHRTRLQKRGFTLVELMLAMSFVSGLLLAIALLIINIMNIYTKGVTMTAVDRAGKIIASDVQRTLNQASPSSVQYISMKNGQDVLGGRLCTGNVSYIWNYGSTITSTNATVQAKANKYTTSGLNIRFQKYADSTSALCLADTDGTYPNLDSTKKNELLESQDRNVVIHALDVSEFTLGAGGQKLYSITMTIGTNNGDESAVIDGQRTCRPPSEGYYDFCSVNVFEFTARSGNKAEG